jgi:acetyl-CoA synthetase
MIRVKLDPQNPNANLGDYEEARRRFSWLEVENTFTWKRTGKCNIVQEAVDRHAADPLKRDRAALVFDGAGQSRSFSFAQMGALSRRWANLLRAQGLRAGDRLVVLLPPCPEIYFAMTACARIGAIFCPLFISLPPAELRNRVLNAAPRGILTHSDLVERLPADALESATPILLTGGALPGCFSRERLVTDILPDMTERIRTRWLPTEAPLYLLYTSGSSGPPKGVVHAHGDMVGHLATARCVLDLGQDSVFWADCEPAWVTGTVYGAFAPWLCGAATIVQADPFSADTWYHTLERHRVSVWYTTPATLQRLMEAGPELPGRFDLSHLRHICTVGERLPPETFFWAMEHLGLMPHDTWWMTETGMICLANFPSMAIKPGAIGRPVPGLEVAVVDEQGNPLPPMSMGELALRPPWPAMMSAIWRDEQRYRAYFHKRGWFMTGDMVIADEEGYFFHQGRMDDLIKVGVQLVGPYEIEQALCRHPAVNEAAVIAKTAKPGEPLIKAFVICNRGIVPSAGLNGEIRSLAESGLSPGIRIRELVFLDKLPKTLSGKILRRALRALDLGLPAGDPARLKDD